MKTVILYQLAFLQVIFAIPSCDGSHSKKSISSEEESIAVRILSVQQSETVGSITATGLLTTESEARYSFKIGGVIDHINVKEGQFFKKGQLLASLKTTEIEAQLLQSSLGYEKARREYIRATNLYRDSVATLEQLQNAKTAMDISKKTSDAIAFNKRYAFIYAQADGFVAKKMANEGEVIGGGAPILATNETSGFGNWVLRLGVTDREWSLIQRGNKALATLDAFPGKVFPGIVSKQSLAADQSSGSFEVEVKIEVPNANAAVGMFGKATIDVAGKVTLPTIPYDAIIEADGNDAFVFVPVDSSRVKKVPIIIESFNNREVVVKSGLENISTIVVSNSAFLNERSIITIIK